MLCLPGEEAGEEEDEEQEEPPAISITPPRQGEVRCASVENKGAHALQTQEVILKLEANMVLSCADTLYSAVQG